MKRKIYQQLLDWKEKRNGEVALLVEGARRIGKGYIVKGTETKNSGLRFGVSRCNRSVDQPELEPGTSRL